jgi:DnaJ-class molecular chaperone
MLLKYHPDKNFGKNEEEIAKCESKFLEASIAYEIIKNYRIIYEKEQLPVDAIN